MEREELRRLGKILHISRNQRLILKLENKFSVRLGLEVFDGKLNSIGTIVDIFGPVSSPYVSIKPSIPHPQRYVGKIVYAPKTLR